MRPAYLSTCPYCGRKVVYGLLQNRHYVTLELRPVPASTYPPTSLYAYRISYGAWVDLGSTRSAPAAARVAHHCAERDEAGVLHGLTRIGDALDDVAPWAPHLCPACLVLATTDANASDEQPTACPDCQTS